MDEVTLLHSPAPYVPVSPSLPPPAARREPLLRGPLILTAISRVLLIPFYFYCAVSASNDAWKILPYLRRYSRLYLADKFLLVGTMWIFTLLSILLTWLFFSRRRAFRPLMVYFCGLFLLLLVCVFLHIKHFPLPHRTPRPTTPLTTWLEAGLGGFMFSGFLWPFYYAFSPRAKRVFTL